MTGDVFEWNIENSIIETKVLPHTQQVTLSYHGMTKPVVEGDTHKMKLTQKYYFKFKDGYKGIIISTYAKLRSTSKFNWHHDDIEAVYYIAFLLGMIDNKMKEVIVTDEDLINRYKFNSEDEHKRAAIELLKSKFESEN